METEVQLTGSAFSQPLSSRFARHDRELIGDRVRRGTCHGRLAEALNSQHGFVTGGTMNVNEHIAVHNLR